MPNPLQHDLDHILAHTEGLWEELRGQRLFVTGGTGFFGRWILESFAYANDVFRLDSEAVVLTRNHAAFAARAEHLAMHSAIRFHDGDVRDFRFPAGCFSYVIHAATDASARMNVEKPLLMFDTIAAGTRRVLDFAVQAGARKLLLTSSGAVYGRQPSGLAHVPEDYRGSPDPLNAVSAYGEGKRVAELLCSLYAGQNGLEVKIARCFAFVGPFLPMDRHYAIGNFIRDATHGKAIVVLGDGSARRSYLYAADLAVWLWTILFRGQSCLAYNVGSDRELTIGDVANMVAECTHGGPVEIRGTRTLDNNTERYVPDVSRARTLLGLSPAVDLRDAICRTLQYMKNCGG